MCVCVCVCYRGTDRYTAHYSRLMSTQTDSTCCIEVDPYESVK